MYNKEDFSFTANAKGYMITYKDKNIGGAGIIGKYKGRGRARTSQIKDYQSQAQSTIDYLVRGIGAKYLLDNIEKIDTDLLSNGGVC